MRGLDENAIADAYESLFRADWQPVVDDLKKLRDDDLNGNEWALFMLIKQVASAYAGRDESMVMRQFLLNQLGYKARMARIAGDNRLTLMVAPDCQLYGCIYVDEGGTRYYDVDAKAPYSFYMCKKGLALGSGKSVSMDAPGIRAWPAPRRCRPTPRPRPEWPRHQSAQSTDASSTPSIRNATIRSMPKQP